MATLDEFAKSYSLADRLYEVSDAMILQIDAAQQREPDEQKTLSPSSHDAMRLPLIQESAVGLVWSTKHVCRTFRLADSADRPRRVASGGASGPIRGSLPPAQLMFEVQVTCHPDCNKVIPLLSNRVTSASPRPVLGVKTPVRSGSSEELATSAKALSQTQSTVMRFAGSP